MKPRANLYLIDRIEYLPVRRIDWVCLVTWCCVLAGVLAFWYHVLKLGGVLW